MRDFSPKKILTVAVREFRSTALTRAFLFGAVIFPLVIWGVLIGVSAINFKKPPLAGTFAVVDGTTNSAIVADLERQFNPEEARRKAKELNDKIAAMAKEQAGKLGHSVSDQQIEQGLKMAQNMTGIGVPMEVTVERLTPDADLKAQRERAMRDEVLAVVKIDERSLALAQPAGQGDGAKAATADPAGTYEFIQGSKLRPDHADQLRGAVTTAIQDERYRRAGIDPLTVRAIAGARATANTVVVTDKGEKKANEGLTRVLPFIFMMLIYVAAVTGGQYLMMGTLEEKGSRVMEVILSAVSARELLIGKLIGQGLVGLAVLGIYSAVGLAAADRFNVLGALPVHVIPWAIVYFLIAYALLGSMMLAVGSAVTEIREAQALYTPITISIILPFILIMPIMQNPGSLLARAASFFPFTTPYAMIMRLSQPSHPIPLWELIATALAGFVGVAVVVWAAAKIFRVGVLMYGKPPSLLGMLKWVRYA